jgi:hypothetical protein
LDKITTQKQNFNHTRRGLEPKTGNFKIFFTRLLKTTYEHLQSAIMAFFRIKRATPSNIGGAA